MGRVWTGAALVAAVAALAFPAAAPARHATFAVVKRGLSALVTAEGGPPGAIATFYRNGHLTVVSVGRARAGHPGAPRAFDHMRLASVSKAYNAAVVLHLVGHQQLNLDDTIGHWLPRLPSGWAPVSLGEMLDHTSGLPDYTRSDGFKKQFGDDPRGYVSPDKVLSWVKGKDLDFPAGSRYEYSNTDNIVLGLIAERATGKSYGALLKQIVFGPARLRQTTFPATVAMPKPFIHGYVVEHGKAPADVSTLLSPSGAWASGAIVSTPAELNTFIRDDLSRRFFGAAQQREQLQFVRGSSSPAGPGGELGRTRDLPLPDPLRHGLRPHRQLPGLRAVGGREPRRQAGGDDVAQHPRPDGQTA